ncbi:MAG: thioredoxin family protein [Verrucomicrobiae bacterium]|nr:thioredoxin family protein [Verrucomicrobiae bacterium]NNJ41992.1 thioredoxin family protein [Akkermansiaceae bacterium]
MKTIQLASLALAMTASIATAGGDGWMTDFEAAKKKAASENKDLLVDFTGSDWCGWCIKLNKEVFSHDPFKKGVADTFVLVELDFPKDTSGISEATQKQNAALKKKFKIRGFPTILLLDAKGLPFARTGYQAGGPEKYVAHLDTLRAKRVARDQGFAAAAKLTGVEKAKALVGVIKSLPDEYLEHYSEVVEQIAKLDPKDETGFVAKQMRKTAMETLAKDVMSAMRAGKTDDAITQIDKFITDNKLEGEEKQGILGMKMNPLLSAKKFDAAAQVIDELIAIDPNSKGAQFAKSFKPRLQKMKEAASQPKKPNPPHGQPGHVHGHGG